MKPIERFQALLDGKKLRLVEWKAVEWFWELDNNNSYIKNQDGEAIGGYWRLLSDEQEWELYEEPLPEIKLTPEDVGKRVRLRCGDVTMIHYWDKGKNKFSNGAASWGPECGNSLHEKFDIVEVLS